MKHLSATHVWGAVMQRIVEIGQRLGIARPPEAAPGAEPRVAGSFPEIERAAADLETLRGEICDALDRRARLVLPGVALALLVLAVALYGWQELLWGLPNLALIITLGILVAWLLVQHRPAQIYRQTLRAINGRSVALALNGFTHTPDPVISKEKLRLWPLFPHVSAVDGFDLFKGQRDGHEVTLCRLNINYHYRARQRRESHRQSNLHAICIKIDASPLDDTSVVLLPDMIDIRIHKAITTMHGLQIADLPPQLEGQFLAFTAPGTAGAGWTAELRPDVLASLGKGDPAIVIFHQGETIAL
ncbi:MAG: hypothetical protein ACK4GT_06995, partial [Pararhodobacter sp.]